MSIAEGGAKGREGRALSGAGPACVGQLALAIAAGVVTDTGGILSHSAICAREYAIPAVVGARVATQRIPDGAISSVCPNCGETAHQKAKPDCPKDPGPTRVPPCDPWRHSRRTPDYRLFPAFSAVNARICWVMAVSVGRRSMEVAP